MNAAQREARQQAVALGREQERLAAANARLTDLETQAEVLTEQYDKTVVEEQQAAAAYRGAVRRLAAARQAEQRSREQVAGLAADEYELGADAGTMAAMLGDARGPQAYLEQLGLGQVLAQQRSDTLATNQADKIVAAVFQAQAARQLRATQTDMRRAARLKTAVEAAVARQLAAVRTTRALTAKLEESVANAQRRARTLASERQSALAAEAAQAAAQAAAAGAADQSGGGASPTVGVAGFTVPTTVAPAWAWSSNATPGDIAANWALTQLGKPYQWGGAGPDSYDCSGLAMVAWAHAGVHLLHYTGYQWEEGTHVPLSDLQRGDLIFYATNNADPATIHHVGIYIGRGYMVDAPYTGSFVRIDSIYQPGYPIGAVRP